MKRPHPRNRIFQLALFGCIAVVIVFSLSWLTAANDYIRHSKLLINLKQLDARLDHNMQQIVTFQMVQYDETVGTLKEIQRRQSQVNEAIEIFSRTDGSLISGAMEDFWAGVEAKHQLLEKIKFQAALVRNGVHFLPTAISDIRPIDPDKYARLLELTNSLFVFNLFASDTDLMSIRNGIETLAAGEIATQQQKELLDNVLFHINANLKALFHLKDLKEQFQRIPSAADFQQLHDHFERYRDTQQRKTRLLTYSLIIVVVFLMIGLAAVLRNLDRARIAMERAWERLHDAVESLSEAFALFDADGKLVLHNRKYLDFYPWLKNQLSMGTGRETIESINRSNLKRINLSGKSFAGSDEGEIHLEQLEGGKWYLASNNRTSEGGVVSVRMDITESKRAEEELRKLSRAMEQSPASVVITDTHGTIEYVNPRFEQISGYSAAEAIGNNPRMLKGGDKTPQEYREMWETLRSGREWRGVFHNKRRDGTYYWESASISPLRNENGEITHFIAVKEDITARKRVEDQLRMNATVFDTTTEGIMVTDPDNRIITVNPAFTRITGYEASEVVGRNPRMLSSGRHDIEFYFAMWQEINRSGHWSGEIWNRRKDGRVYPEWLSVAAIKNEKSEVTEYVAVFSDISQRKESERQIRYQANYDALTNLPNRSLLQDRLNQSIVSAKRESWKMGLLFVDLDKFKIVNDNFGHVMGDELLQRVAGRLKSSVREADTVARFGGDEFVILLQDISEANDAAIVAEKIISALRSPFDLSGREIFIGASIGISLYPDDTELADNLLLNADMAMYQAKEKGRHRYQFFTMAMQEQVRIQQGLEQDLRWALERRQLHLVYQPIVRTDTSELAGFEALLRWEHPEMAAVSPETFIPIAEDTGLIDTIGKWVLETACGQLVQWMDKWQRQDLVMSVNLSSRQRELGLDTDSLSGILQRTALSGSHLNLEITEGLLMEQKEEVVVWLHSLRMLGVTLSVDDFGTGYSSLSYLKRFPVDAIKIDRSFVRDIPHDSDDVSLVEAIVAMSRSLGLKLVAEGIENIDQLEFLTACGCDYLQGYHFGKPMTPDQVVSWYRKRYGKGLYVISSNEPGG